VSLILCILLFFFSREAMRKVKERQKYVHLLLACNPHVFTDGTDKWSLMIWSWSWSMQMTQQTFLNAVVYHQSMNQTEVVFWMPSMGKIALV